MGKTNMKNLQPWLDWFGLLRVYSDKGYLSVQPDKGEAYITEPAFYTLANIDLPTVSTLEPVALAKANDDLLTTVGRIKAYADYLAAFNQMEPPGVFALHVVKPEPPHDPRYTIVAERRKLWYCPWRKTTDYRFIYY